MKKSTPFLLTALAIWLMAFACNDKNLMQTAATPVGQRLVLDDTSAYAPQLTILQKKEHEEEPTLQSLSVKVETWGNAAVTTLDMTFYNPNARVLEAEMVFPLGENQRISRLAVEKNGTLQEGVVVEKNKGQEVFEDIERRNVDPVLVEHVAGNNYRARIYPVPANSTKRIVISYEQELSIHDHYLLYHLPLAYNMVLPHFNLEVLVHNAKPDSITLDQPQIKTAFQLQNDEWMCSVKREGQLLREHVAFIIPLGDKKEMMISQFDHNENKTYFFASLILPANTRPKPRPENLLFYWDVSGSCDSASQVKYRELVTAYLAHFKPSQVDVIPFSYTVHDRQSFRLSNGTSAELISYLSHLTFDGGTQFGSILNASGYSEVFVFSDGLTNYGKDTPGLADAPVNCITASVNADYGLLRAVSEKTGGRMINLVENTVDDAMKKLTTQPLQLISATVPDITGTHTSHSIYPSNGPIEGNSLTVAGYCEIPGDLQLRIGYDAASSYVVTVNTSPNSNGILAKRLWAQKKLESLSMRADKNKEEMMAVAKKFHLVTPLTSLLFLDTITDYIRYEVEPPAPLKEAYFKAMADKDKQKAEDKQQHVEQVVTWFKSREEWWNKDFTPEHMIPKKIKKNNNKSRTSNGEHEESMLEIIEDRASESDPANAEVVYAFDASGIGSGNGAGLGENLSFSLTSTEDVDNADDLDKNKERDGRLITTKKIALAAWNPETPYLTQLKKIPSDQLYPAYLDMRKEYAKTPSFFVDVSDFLFSAGQHENAVRVLSNLAEVDIKNYRLMRILAHRLEHMHRLDESIAMFEKVMVLRKEEPQSYRDLALVLAENNQHQQAIEVMYELISKNWNSRFPEIELIAAGELNHIIASSPKSLNTSFIDSRLLKNMPMDARVILNWDADNCDIDLWVTDPRGEKCFYSHRDTKIGGHNSADLTGGYGPEEFIIHKAMKGKYTIEINYYGDRQQSINGPTTVQLEIYTDYGMPSQKVNKVTRRLTDKKETLEIGAFEVE